MLAGRRRFRRHPALVPCPTAVSGSMTRGARDGPAANVWRDAARWLRVARRGLSGSPPKLTVVFVGFTAVQLSFAIGPVSISRHVCNLEHGTLVAVDAMWWCGCLPFVFPLAYVVRLHETRTVVRPRSAPPQQATELFRDG